TSCVDPASGPNPARLARASGDCCAGCARVGMLTARAADWVSVESVVAPEVDQVAIEVRAQRLDFALEADAQLAHQLLVRWMWLALDDLAPRRAQGFAAQV